MKLGIYTIEKTLYEGEVKEVIAKTTTGEISILQNHIPLVTRLTAGPLAFIAENGGRSELLIQSGFLEVQPEDGVVVLTDTV